jgi:hypothetical protein
MSVGPSGAAVKEFQDLATKLRDLRRASDDLHGESCLRELEDSNRLHILRSLYLNLAESAKRREIMEAQVTRALVHGATGGDGAGPSRAELEAKVRDLELKVAALEGKVSVLQEDRDTIREKLFAMLGAGTKQ